MWDEYILLEWPYSQEVMSLEGFKENSCLLNEEPLLSEYGSLAYFIRKEWAIKQGIYIDSEKEELYHKLCLIPRWIRKIFKAL